MNVLRDLGMTTMFGNPGSTELRFLKDWPEDFTYVMGLHESCSVAMADAFAQITGNAAFVSLHRPAASATRWARSTPPIATTRRW